MLVIGAALGRLLGDLDRRHIEIARDNLRRAFPEWDETRVRRVARDVYGHFGRVLLDIVWLSGRSREQILALIDVENGHQLDALRENTRGCMIVTAHLGNWEACGVAHGWLFRPMDVIARPLDNPALDERLVAFRRRSGNTVIYKQKALAHILRALRANREVAFLLDQNVQEKDGIFVDFFGRKAAATTVASALAVKTGAVVLPTHAILKPDGRYRLTYGAPLPWTPPATARPTSRRSRRASRPSSRAGCARRRSSGCGCTAAGRRSRRRRRPRERARAHPGARAQLAGRRGAVAARAARPARAASRSPAWRCSPARPWSSCTGRWRRCTACGSPRTRARTPRRVRGAFDLGVLFTNSFGSALSLRLARVPERWGYATEGRGPLLTRRARVPAAVRGRSQVYYYRAMLAALGLRVSAEPDASLRAPAHVGGGRGPPARSRPLDRPQPGRRVRRRQALAGRALRGRRRTRWPGGRARRWRSLGSASERPLADEVAAAMRHPARVLAGETPARGARGRPGPPRLLVTNDSGPMHVASALGTPRRGRLRADRRARDGARGSGAHAHRARAGALRALRAARVPDRPRLHAARRRRSASPSLALELLASVRPAIFMDRDGTALARDRLREPRRRASGRSRTRWTRCAW